MNLISSSKVIAVFCKYGYVADEAAVTLWYGRGEAKPVPQQIWLLTTSCEGSAQLVTLDEPSAELIEELKVMGVYHHCRQMLQRVEYAPAASPDASGLPHLGGSHDGWAPLWTD